MAGASCWVAADRGGAGLGAAEDVAEHPGALGAPIAESIQQLLELDEEIKNDAVITEIKRRAHALGELNRNLGDEGAWSAEINAEIDRRLKP